MSHRVSPFLTVWVLGAWASAGAASPSAHRRERLERQIVILGIESLRKVGERLVLGTGLGGCRRSRGFGRGIRLTTITFAGQENQLAGIDLRRVPGLAFLVLPAPIFDAAFDVNLVALLTVALCDVSKIRALVVPDYDTVPFGLFLLVPGGPFPLPAGGQGAVGDPASIGGAADFGIGAQVADQLNTIEAAGHGILLTRGIRATGLGNSPRLPAPLVIYLTKDTPNRP